MTQVPSNLIPTRVTQLPEPSNPSQEGYLVYVYEGRTYKVRAGDLLLGTVPDGSITSAKLAPGAVTNSNIADFAVTGSKIANSSVTTDKVVNGAITPEKLSVAYARSGNNSDIVSLAVLNSLTFTDTPDALVPRRMAWNNAEGTADLALLDGTILQLGQELHYRARNGTSNTIPDGTAVWAIGTIGNSGKIAVGPAVADGSRSLKTVMGLMTHDTAADSDGYVTAFGKVRGVNTTGSSVGETWSDGDILYVHPSIPGKLTNQKPETYSVTMALVIHAHTNGTLFVRPTVDQSLTRTFERTATIYDVFNSGYAGSDGSLTLACTVTDAVGTTSSIVTVSGEFTTTAPNQTQPSAVYIPIPPDLQPYSSVYGSGTVTPYSGSSGTDQPISSAAIYSEFDFSRAELAFRVQWRSKLPIFDPEQDGVTVRFFIQYNM